MFLSHILHDSGCFFPGKFCARNWRAASHRYWSPGECPPFEAAASAHSPNPYQIPTNPTSIYSYAPLSIKIHFKLPQLILFLTKRFQSNQFILLLRRILNLLHWLMLPQASAGCYPINMGSCVHPRASICNGFIFRKNSRSYRILNLELESRSAQRSWSSTYSSLRS